MVIVLKHYNIYIYLFLHAVVAAGEEAELLVGLHNDGGFLPTLKFKHNIVNNFSIFVLWAFILLVMYSCVMLTNILCSTRSISYSFKLINILSWNCFPILTDLLLPFHWSDRFISQDCCGSSILTIFMYNKFFYFQTVSSWETSESKHNHNKILSLYYL